MSLIDKKSITTSIAKEHGIGAMVYREYNNTSSSGSDGSRIQNIVFITTIKVRNNKFGERFITDFATRQERSAKISMWTLNGILMVVQPEVSVGTSAVWVYTCINNHLPKILWFIEGYQAFNFKYSALNLYQAGGKIEDKLTITTKQFKDGHVYEKVVGTYSVWGKNSIPTVEKYYDREGIV